MFLQLSILYPLDSVRQYPRTAQLLSVATDIAKAKGGGHCLPDQGCEPFLKLVDTGLTFWAEADQRLKLARARIADLQRAHCIAPHRTQQD